MCIRDSCGIFHSYENSENGYYRIYKGFVSGKKVGGVWEIDFEVWYGGKKNDKYRMIKDAKYTQ